MRKKKCYFSKEIDLKRETIKLFQTISDIPRYV